MDVLYHDIKTRYAYDFPLCFPHELIMNAISKTVTNTVNFGTPPSGFHSKKYRDIDGIWMYFISSAEFKKELAAEFQAHAVQVHPNSLKYMYFAWRHRSRGLYVTFFFLEVSSRYIFQI